MNCVSAWTYAITVITMATSIASVATAQSDDAAPDQESSANAASDQKSSGDATPVQQGVLPIPDYAGDLSSRSTLLGDLNGARTSLAEHGIQFGVDWSTTLQSVVTGGRDTGAELGTALDYNFKFDLMRMNLIPGGLVEMKVESRFGESVNGNTGGLLPVSSDLMFPLTSPLDENVPVTITNLKYSQFFSDEFGVFIGKFDTLNGDPNEFASGRGVTQFQDLNFVFSPALLVTAPYSTLGGGAFYAPNKYITATASVFATADSSTTTGFETLDEGLTFNGEINFQYRIGKLPGGFNVGGSYAWDNNFATIGRRFTFHPGVGLTPTPDENTSWAAYGSAWQYLIAHEDEGETSGPLNSTNGIPDLRGIGVFGRIGFADPGTNPIDFAVSAGIGGKGLIPGRGNDVFGVGYYYTSIQTRRLTSALGLRDSIQGVEAFYNIAVTPATGLTLSAQVVEPVTDNLDTAVVLGARLLLRF